MFLRWICIFSYAVVLQFPLEGNAQNEHDLTNAKVTLRESFGLHTEPENGKYKVRTFIPRAFLLFDIDEELAQSTSGIGDKYLAATTQDGVRLFVLKSAVSKGAYTQVYGSQDIIFNRSHAICLSIHCDIQDDDQLLKINAGDVFQKVEFQPGDNSVFKLIGNRGNRNSQEIVEGYIRNDDLNTLNHKAIVTYASLKHPRYSLETFESQILGSPCGKPIPPNKTVSEISDSDESIINALDLAEISADRRNIIFKKIYGGEDKEVVYRLYNLSDQRVDPPKPSKYAAQITYRCDSKSIMFDRTFIESVVLINVETESISSFDPLGTPDDLYEIIKAPYMYSVNSERHYFLLMDKLSKEFESRALAGFFLAGFNRSCSGADRKTEQKCQHSAYEDSQIP